MAACIVERAIQALPARDARTLRDALSGKLYSAESIAEVLRPEGHVMSPSSIRTHRRRKCPCYLGSVSRPRVTLRASTVAQDR